MEMNITLKKVKHIKEFSEETDCFIASVYWKGKKVATAKNEGRGGETEIRFDRGVSESLKTEIAAWCSGHPKIYKDYRYKSLADHVDWAFVNWEKEQRIADSMKEGFVYTKEESGDVYLMKIANFQRKIAKEDYQRLFRPFYDRLVAKGCKILNTNLPENWQ